MRNRDGGLKVRTLTFIFTDIEGSTRLQERLKDDYRPVLADHNRLLREAFTQYEAEFLTTEGDSVIVAFERPKYALAAALDSQLALLKHGWPGGAGLKVRMGIHTGEVVTTPDGYVGLALNQAARIRAAAHGGQVLISAATRTLLQEELPAGASLQDLGEHRLKDLSLPQRLFQFCHPDLPAEFPPLHSLSIQPNNLPIQLTAFVGREPQIKEVIGLFSRARLITLVGSGGSGKTRLALQVAGYLAGDYPDGVWFVDLATINDPSSVTQATASAVGVQEEPGRPLADSLVEGLAAKRLLVVLDNCEHLIDACAELAGRLLRECPELRILATSREGLDIPGEITWRVPSLAHPKQNGDEVPEQIEQFESVQLFLERASRARSGFALTKNNAVAVAQIVSRLDGIPLAIELAAAKVQVLPVDELRARLSDHFKLLTGGARSRLGRQQTLSAAVDWSYGLLTEEERMLLRRLSVFSGGWTLDEAEEICHGDGIDRALVLDLLARLVAKSLVLFEEQETGARYRMLEMIRQFGNEKLREANEASGFRRRHRDWFLDFAEIGEPQLRGGQVGSWLTRLSTEYDNLRASLEWSVSEENWQQGLRLAAAISRFWETRGYWSEGRRWLEQVLSGPHDSSHARRKALTAAGRLAWRQGDRIRAKALLEESLEAARSSEDREVVADALTGLANLHADVGEREQARVLWEESLSLKQALEDAPGAVAILNNFAVIADTTNEAITRLEEALATARQADLANLLPTIMANLALLVGEQGETAYAISLLEEGLAGTRRIGDPATEGFILASLADVTLIGSRELAEQARRLSCELGFRSLEAASLVQLGTVELFGGDLEEARQHLEEALSIARRLDDRHWQGRALAFLGAVAREEGDWSSAIALGEEAVELLQAMNWHYQWRGLIRLMETLRLHRDFERALALADEIVERANEAGPKWPLVHALYDSAEAKRALGEVDTAMKLQRDVLSNWSQFEWKIGIAGSLEAVAALTTEYDPSKAAKLFGAAEALREGLGAPLLPSFRSWYEVDLSRLKERLSGTKLDHEWREGKKISSRDAVKLALAD